MNTRTAPAILLAIGLLLLAALACGSLPSDPSSTEPFQQAVSGAATAGGPDEMAMVEVPAPIKSFTISTSESTPPQYFVEVTSRLDTICDELKEPVVSRNGDEFVIMLTNLEADADVLMQPLCWYIFGAADTSIPLGTDLEAGKTYTVTVNDVSTTFVAQGGPVEQDESQEPAFVTSAVTDEGRVELSPDSPAAAIGEQIIEAPSPLGPIFAVVVVVVVASMTFVYRGRFYIAVRRAWRRGLG